MFSLKYFRSIEKTNIISKRIPERKTGEESAIEIEVYLSDVKTSTELEVILFLRIGYF